MSSHAGEKSGVQGDAERFPRFPFGVPNGWYIVAFSEDLQKGELLALRYFGRELVLFRGETGTAHLMDAYCPHLGAHLGVGGRVVEDTLRCPFHAWRWDGEGRCVEIPYSERIPPGARLSSYSIAEHSGFIWAWVHAGLAEPSFRIPRFEEYGADDWTRSWIRFDWKVRTHPQEVFENGVDFPHFQSVHGFEFPSNIGMEFDGPWFRWWVETARATDDADAPGEAVRQESTVMALGASRLRYTGDLDTLMAFGTTPIDADNTHIRLCVIGRKQGRSDAEMGEILEGYVAEQARNLAEDFPIWEHKRYRARPSLCEADGPIPRFREWASQFYDPREATNE